MKNYRITDKTGKVAAVKVVEETDDVMIISDDGTIIRTPVSSINIYGRGTQGVRVMRVAEGVKVIAVARVDHQEEEEAAAEEAGQ
jgi:DNA gyrase subunit A